MVFAEHLSVTRHSYVSISCYEAIGHTLFEWFPILEEEVVLLNDLPPFKLSPEEGNCTYLGKSCNVSQTIRFSTQPLC